MAYVINTEVAPDAYSAASTMDNLPNASSINIDVANQPVYWQVRQVVSPSTLYTEATWQEETYMLPGSRSLYRPNLRGFRFRAAIPVANLPAGASQAVVTAEAVT